MNMDNGTNGQKTCADNATEGKEGKNIINLLTHTN